MLIKKCSKCSINFECCNVTSLSGKQAAGCWCEQLHIDLETLNKLKKEFANCLCNNCLKEYSKTLIPEKK